MGIAQIIYLAFAVISTAYQVYQAKKQRDAAKKAEEARKGFEFVTDMPASTLPIVYGRALVGGVRVYATTRNNFNYTAPNSDKVFLAGASEIPEEIVDEVSVEVDPATGLPNTTTVQTTRPAIESRKLNSNKTGTKNEFLFIQQVLCQGPIHNVYDATIDRSLDIDEPSLGGTDNKTPKRNTKSKAAFRIDVHYGDGERACEIMRVNDGARQDAKFPNMAYATGVFCLDRDNPQLNNVPDMQFYVEGRKVRKVNTGVLSNTREYSNNPAWCLLDYLLDDTSGKGLSIDQIDLSSFEDAARLCDTEVLPNAVMGGKVWQPVDGSRNVTRRTIPLYECNIIIDTEKNLRDNVQSILSTMGDARLVWSQGKYKLILQYPETNADIELAAHLTDDDLVMGEEISIAWPNSSERMNFATIKFHDEAMDFKENTVSWPPKEAGIYWKPVGADSYPPMSGWDGYEDWKQLLNTYGVWSGPTDTSHMSWKFVVKNSGVHLLDYAAEKAATVSVNGSTIEPAGTNQKQHSFMANRDDVVTIQVNATTEEKSRRGFAGRIIDPSGVMPWTSRSPAYKEFIRVDQKNEVYTRFIEEDSDVPLEADIFAEGITDYYHALAKAEELVRTSRSAFSIRFRYIVRSRYLEPGDFIRLDSVTAGVEELYIRVNEVKLQSDNIAEVTGSRFDWTQLAWNVDDNAYATPTSVYDSHLPAPEWVRYIPTSDTIHQSSGMVDWATVDDSRVVGYIVYVHETGQMDVDGDFLFVELGRAPAPKFRLPALSVNAGIFGVRSYTQSGRMSEMTLSGSLPINNGKQPPDPENVRLVASDIKAAIEISWETPEKRADDSKYDDHQATLIYRAHKWNDFEKARLLASVPQGSIYTDLDEQFGEMYYWVVNVSQMGRKSGHIQGEPVPIEFNHFAGAITDPTVPNTPFNVTVTSGLSFLWLTWEWIDNRAGGGLSHFEIYRSENNNIANAQLVGKSDWYGHIYNSELGTDSWFWIVAVTKGGGRSEYSEPANGRVGLINGVDLGPEIIDAYHIREGGITASRLAQELGAVVFIPSDQPMPTEKVQDGRGDLISYKGILYKWDDIQGKYVALINFEEIEGVLTADQIADEIITTSKFARGLTPIEIVDTLPTSDLKEGRVVYLTTDGKLYRYTGSTWSAEVQTVDLSGQLSAEHIADGIIKENAFAVGLAPIKTVSELPLTGTVGQVVLLTTDKKMYRYDGTQWTSKIPAADLSTQITAGMIAANAVEAGHIQAGAVSTHQLAANSITSEKIAVNSLAGDRITAGTMNADRLNARSITSELIATNVIKSEHLVTDAVTAGKIAAGAVRAREIYAYSISGDKLAFESITGYNIAGGTITGDKIAANTITAQLLYSGSVNANKINAAHIATGSLTADRLAAGTITASSGVINTGAIQNFMLGNGVITSVKIAEAEVGSLQVAGNSVIVPQIVGGFGGTVNNGGSVSACSLSFNAGPASRGTPVGTVIVMPMFFMRSMEDAMGRLKVYVDGLLIAQTDFGLRVAGGSNTDMSMPIMLSGAVGAKAGNVWVEVVIDSIPNGAGDYHPFNVGNFRCLIIGGRR